MESEHDPEGLLVGDRRYRVLVEAIADYAVYLLDPNGVITSWNTGAERFKGYVADEIIGAHFSRFYVPEDQHAGLPQRALATATREDRFEGEGWRVRKDGTRFWAQVVIDPVRSATTGKLIGFAKITRDISERRLTEESLKRSEERFDLLVQSVTDYAIYMLDARGTVTNWNLGAERIKGYAPDEIIGCHFSRFYTDVDRANEAPARALQTAAREGRFESEGWRVRKDGSHFLANVVIDPIRDTFGTVIGYAKVTRDITEKHEVQRALEATREALFQSQKLDAIGQLTGGVAHDFNNLLMAVLGSLALARKRLPAESNVLPLIENAVRAAKRGAVLTQRMLAFAGRQELKPEPVELPALVAGMSDLLMQSTGTAIEVETRFPLKLRTVMADANQLELAILNLIINARDAMPNGGCVVISGREDVLAPDNAPRLAPGTYVRLSIADTGEGMDAATLARATEPFFTTKGVGKGTGLGLSMVDGMAAQTGGRFMLVSQQGVGTTAELWLPLAGLHAPRPSVRPFEVPAPVRAHPAGQRLTVLAVDDDALVLTNTSAMLEELGHTVLSASAGDEALQILEREPAIQLIVSDQVMPRMKGSQLIAAARAQRPDLGFILATGYSEYPLDLGAEVQRLAKPFTEAELEQAIASVVSATMLGTSERTC